jgi:cellulose synthase/poly-beta-1,6-N-acetylglucosamine synthase-like glycosyltransferase
MVVYVIADHCTDNTTQRALSAGATVFIRDEGHAGKTYALGWALQMLESRRLEPDVYVVTDATARVHPDFIRALAVQCASGEDIVVGHSLLDVTNERWFAKCLGLTLVHRNLQNWARDRLGLSALIEGRGMAYSRRYIQRFGWSLAMPTSASADLHPTEDWRHGVRAVEHGFRVAFAGTAKVFTPLRDTLGAATRQGIRWERGRMANALTHGFELLRNAIRKPNRLMTFAALDSIQPPVAILGALAAITAALAILFPGGGPLLAALSIAPLGLMVAYGIVVVLRGGSDGISPSTVLWAPVYVAWRCAAFVIASLSLDRILGNRKKQDHS